MSSSAAFAGSKTSAVSPPDTTSSPGISWSLFISPISGKLHLKLASVIRLGPRTPVSCMTCSSSRLPFLMVRLRTVACVSVGSVGRKSASTFAACGRAACFLAAPSVPSAPVSLDRDKFPSAARSHRPSVDGIPGTASIADCEPQRSRRRSDPACRVVVDRSERMAVRAKPAKKGIRLRLMIHDRVCSAAMIFLLSPIDKPMSPSNRLSHSCLCGPPSGMCRQIRSGPRS